MKPLICLLTVFLILFLAKKVGHFPRLTLSLSGRIAMACMLLMTGISHFPMAEGMALMLPEWLPFKIEVVYTTGILEILSAIGLLMPSTQRLTGWMLIIFFFLIFPANILAALNHVNIQEANLNGPGSAYLWFRVPLQVFFIGWVWYFTIKNPSGEVKLTEG
ncbi:hypothetical protein AAG747_07585 [Rapidithrix thailandica]|uniref:DoxX family protein n=1 Tax=Rapidithrix thailandica TaxID=413964 RepID=A0AAW9S494_9BACT